MKGESATTLGSVAPLPAEPAAQRTQPASGKGRSFDGVLQRSVASRQHHTDAEERHGDTAPKPHFQEAWRAKAKANALTMGDSVALQAALQTVQEPLTPSSIGAEIERSLPAAPVYAETVFPDEMHRPILECVRVDAPQLQIRLHPPDLGPMNLKVSLDDKVLRVLFEASTDQAMNALQNGIPALRNTLLQHGLTLAECSIRLLAKSRQGSRPHEEKTP